MAVRKHTRAIIAIPGGRRHENWGRGGGGGSAGTFPSIFCFHCNLHKAQAKCHSVYTPADWPVEISEPGQGKKWSSQLLVPEGRAQKDLVEAVVRNSTLDAPTCSVGVFISCGAFSLEGFRGLLRLCWSVVQRLVLVSGFCFFVYKNIYTVFSFV